MAKRIGLQPVGSAMIADTWNYERYKTLMERDAAVLRLSVNGMSSDWPSTCIAKPGNLLLKKLFSFVSPALLSCGSVRHKPSRIFGRQPPVIAKQRRSTRAIIVPLLGE
jgi:hypothetical protein